MKGDIVGLRRRQHARMGAQRLGEAFAPTWRQAAGIHDDNIVMAKAQIDVACVADLAEHNQGCRCPARSRPRTAATTRMVRRRPDDPACPAVGRKIDAGRKPDRTRAG